jgi:hypothetical protein
MRDSNGATSSPATISVTVNPASPTASNDTASAGHRTLTPASNDTASSGAVLNASTVDLDPTTPGIQRTMTVANQGIWNVIDNNGTVSFDPVAGFYGTATLNYAISDSLGNTATATMAVPIDPSGVVYNSSTRLPIAAATVTLLYNGLNANSYVVGGNASLSTSASGQYAFFILPGAPAGTYSLVVSSAGYTSPSGVIPPTAVGWGAGGPSTAVVGPPTGSQATTYYLSGPLPSVDVINNNIPLDPIPVVAPPSTVTPVPTLSEWMMLALASTLLLWGGLAIRRQKV